MAIAIETNLDSRQLVDFSIEFKRRMGRERREKWATRLIGIDIIAMNAWS